MATCAVTASRTRRPKPNKPLDADSQVPGTVAGLALRSAPPRVRPSAKHGADEGAAVLAALQRMDLHHHLVAGLEGIALPALAADQVRAARSPTRPFIRRRPWCWAMFTWIQVCGLVHWNSFTVPLSSTTSLWPGSNTVPGSGAPDRARRPERRRPAAIRANSNESSSPSPLAARRSLPSTYRHFAETCPGRMTSRLFSSQT